LLGLGEAGDKLMSDGVYDLVSYHGESVFEAVEATAGKRLLFEDRTSNALLLFDRFGHVGSFTIWAAFPTCIRLVNPDKHGRDPCVSLMVGVGETCDTRLVT
jgi:hypothetical protein